MTTHIAILCYGDTGTRTMAYLQQDSQLQQRHPNRLRLSWKNLNQTEAQRTATHTVNRADMVLIIGDNTTGRAASSALHIAKLCEAKGIHSYALLALPADSSSQYPEIHLLQQTASNTLLIPPIENDNGRAAGTTEQHLADAVLTILHPLGSDWLFNLDVTEIRHLLQTGAHCSFAKATSSNNNACEATLAALELLPELNKINSLLCNLNTQQNLPLEQLVQVNNLLREHSHPDCHIMQSCSLHPQTENTLLEVGITVVWPKPFDDLRHESQTTPSPTIKAH